MSLGVLQSEPEIKGVFLERLRARGINPDEFSARLRSRGIDEASFYSRVDQKLGRQPESLSPPAPPVTQVPGAALPAFQPTIYDDDRPSAEQLMGPMGPAAGSIGPDGRPVFGQPRNVSMGEFLGEPRALADGGVDPVSLAEFNQRAVAGAGQALPAVQPGQRGVRSDQVRAAMQTVTPERVAEFRAAFPAFQGDDQAAAQYMAEREVFGQQGTMDAGRPTTAAQDATAGFVSRAAPRLQEFIGPVAGDPSSAAGMVGGFAGGLTNPPELAAMALPVAAELKLARPIVAKLIPILGRRGAHAVGGAMVNMPQAAAMTAAEAIANTPEEAWEEDFWGTLGRVATAAGVSGGLAGLLGGGFGAAAKKFPKFGRAPTRADFDGLRERYMAAENAESASIGQTAMRDAAEAYRGAPREAMDEPAGSVGFSDTPAAPPRTPADPRGAPSAVLKRGSKVPAGYVFHNTTGAARNTIAREGMIAGAFSDRPIGFNGDVWLAVKREDIGGTVQSHDYGGTPAHEPTWGEPAGTAQQTPIIPPDRIYVVDKRGRVVGRLDELTKPQGPPDAPPVQGAPDVPAGRGAAADEGGKAAKGPPKVEPGFEDAARILGAEAAEADRISATAQKVKGPATPEQIRDTVRTAHRDWSVPAAKKRMAEDPDGVRSDITAQVYRSLAEKTRMPPGLDDFDGAVREAAAEQKPGHRSAFGVSPSPLLRQVRSITDELMPKEPPHVQVQEGQGRQEGVLTDAKSMPRTALVAELENAGLPTTGTTPILRKQVEAARARASTNTPTQNAPEIAREKTEIGQKNAPDPAQMSPEDLLAEIEAAPYDIENVGDMGRADLEATVRAIREDAVRQPSSERLEAIPEPAPSPKETAAPASGERPAKDPARETTINEIVNVAADQERSRGVPVQRSSVKGEDGRWYSPMHLPTHTKMTGEERLYWVIQTKDGTTGGNQYPTSEALVAARDERIAKNSGAFRAELENMSPEQIASQADYWLKKPAAEATKPAQKPEKTTLSHDAERRAELKKLRAKQFKTAGDETSIFLKEGEIKANADRWKPGTGVGYYAGPATKGRRGSQINRGFRVAEVDAESKMARLEQVADTGLTTTGGNADKIEAEWVHVADLVRDGKYDAPAAVQAHKTTATLTPYTVTIQNTSTKAQTTMVVQAKSPVDARRRATKEGIDGRIVGVEAKKADEIARDAPEGKPDPITFTDPETGEAVTVDLNAKEPPRAQAPQAEAKAQEPRVQAGTEGTGAEGGGVGRKPLADVEWGEPPPTDKTELHRLNVQKQDLEKKSKSIRDSRLNAERSAESAAKETADAAAKKIPVGQGYKLLRRREHDRVYGEARRNDPEVQRLLAKEDVVETQIGDLDSKIKAFEEKQQADADAFTESQRERLVKATDDYPWWEIDAEIKRLHAVEEAGTTYGQASFYNRQFTPPSRTPEAVRAQRRREILEKVATERAGRFRGTEEIMPGEELPPSFDVGKGLRGLSEKSVNYTKPKRVGVSEAAVEARGLRPSEYATAVVPDRLSVVRDEGTNVQKFKAFIREVGEFRKDPNLIVVTDKAGVVTALRWQDGGRFTFTDPVRWGFILPDGLKEGQRIRVDPDAVLKMKPGDGLEVKATGDKPPADARAEFKAIAGGKQAAQRPSLVTDGPKPKPAPEPELPRETVAKPKPLNIAGKTRPDRPAPVDRPPLPQKSIDLMDEAIRTRDVAKLAEMVDPANKGWRAQFTKQTGVELPNTVGGSEKAVREWANTPDQPRDRAPGTSGGAMASPPTSLPAPTTIKPGRISPSPIKPTGTPKPIREMLVDLGDVSGKVRTGKPARSSIGTYYPGSSKAVIRFANDLDTASHEIAHRLDDLYGIVATWATPRGISKSGQKLPQKSPFDAELRSDIFQHTSRPGYKVVQKRAEGVAEFIRAWILNPDEAKANAPQFSAFFESKVPADVRAKLRAFGDDVRKWAGSSSTERTLSNVDVGLAAPGLMERIKDAFASEGVGGSIIDKLNASVNDALAPVWKGVALAKTLRGVSNLLPEHDPKTRLRLFAGFDRKAMDVLNSGPVTFRGERVKDTGGLDWLLEPLDQTSRSKFEDDFRKTIAFGLSQRTIERLGHLLREDPVNGWRRAQRISGSGGGIFSDAATAMEAMRELATDPAQLKRITDAATRYRKWGDNLLQYMVDGGRITAQNAADIRDANNYYFAMKRLMETIDPTLFRAGGRKLASVAQPIKRFEGSTRTIENPYVSLMEQTYAMMRETDRNAGLSAFADLIDKPRGMYQGKPIDFDQIGSRAKTGDPDAITIYRNGKGEKWQFAPAIHKALKDWGINNTPNFLVRAAMIPARILRAGVTLAPSFIVRQQIRDPLSRAIVSRSGSKPYDHLYFTTPAGAHDFRVLLSEFERHGGGLFGYQGVTRDNYYRQMRDEIRKIDHDPRAVLSFPLHVARGYKRFVELGETVGRLAEYKRAYAKAKASGMDDHNAALRAAFEARDIQDFAVAGTVTRAINQFVPFTTAAIRGLGRSITAAHENPKAFAARWLVYVASLELANYAWNHYTGAEDDVAELSPFRRDFFWNYKLGDFGWLTIPKPYELGVMGSGVSRAIDAARGREDSFKGFLGSVMSAASPLGISDAAAGPFKALSEVMMNHDMFSGREIVPTYERFGRGAKPAGERTGEDRASPAGRAIAGGMNRMLRLIDEAYGVDARYVDKFIDGQLGNVGRMVTGDSASEIGMRATGVLSPQYQREMRRPER